MELKADKTEETEGEVVLVYFHPDELRTKEFNDFIDRMLERGDADEEAFAKLTPVQRHIYSVLNRAFARFKRKLSDNKYGTEIRETEDE